MAILDTLTTRNVSLPLIGTVGLPVVVIGGLAVYLLVFRKRGKVTSVTTRYRK